MAQTVEEIEAELVKLRAASSEGVLSVSHSDGRQVTFQSLDAIRREIRIREDALRRLQGRPRRRLARLYQRGTGM